MRLNSMAGEIQAAGGIITAADMNYTQPTIDVPLNFTVGNLQLLMPPPPSSAAVLGLALGILADYNSSEAYTDLLGTYRMVRCTCLLRCASAPCMLIFKCALSFPPQGPSRGQVYNVAATSSPGTSNPAR